MIQLKDLAKKDLTKCRLSREIAHYTTWECRDASQESTSILHVYFLIYSFYP